MCGGLSLSRSQPKAGASHSTKGPLQSLKASTDPSHSLVSPTPAHPADTSGPTGQLPTITSNQIRPIERCAALASAAYHLLAPGISLLPYKHQHTCQFSFIWLPNTVHHSDAPTRQAVRITWLREHFSLSESLWSSRSSAWLRQASRARDWGERLWLGAWRCKFGMRWMEGWRGGGGVEGPTGRLSLTPLHRSSWGRRPHARTLTPLTARAALVSKISLVAVPLTHLVHSKTNYDNSTCRERNPGLTEIKLGNHCDKNVWLEQVRKNYSIAEAIRFPSSFSRNVNRL